VRIDFNFCTVRQAARKELAVADPVGSINHLLANESRRSRYSRTSWDLPAVSLKEWLKLDFATSSDMKIKINKMEQRGKQNIQADEKSGLLAKERQIEAPVEPLRKRQYVVRGLVAVLVAFAWLSVVGIENLLSRQPKGSELDKVEGNRKHVDYEDVIP